MKIFVPQHVEGNFFSSYVRIWPFELRLWQFLVILVGVALGGVIYTRMAKDPATKTLGMILGGIVFLFFLFVALFKISELTLVPFLAKKIKDHFFDTSKKYQVNYPKIWPIDLGMAEAKSLKSQEPTKPVIQKPAEEEVLKKVEELDTKW